MTTRRPIEFVAAMALLAAAGASAQTAAPGAAAPAAPVASAAVAPPPAPPSPVGQPAPIPRSRWTPAQVRQSFDQADVNGDGQLTRAEAQRLTIMPHSFEDMDRNKDGVLDRSEYEAAFTSQ